jgi:hypothetical protein
LPHPAAASTSSSPVEATPFRYIIIAVAWTIAALANRNMAGK